MAIPLLVKWVEQSAEPEPHQRIRHIGGASRDFRWKHSHDEAIQFIERDTFDYYVEDNLRIARLNVAQTDGGKKYLTTEAVVGQQLILVLPQFPQETPAVARV